MDGWIEGAVDDDYHPNILFKGKMKKARACLFR